MKTATLGIIIRGEQVLLGLKQGNPEIGEGTLNGPGGKVEPGETLMECLVRETEEELGIALDPRETEKVAIITFHDSGTPKFEVHVYRTERFSGEPRETESMIPEWHRVDALPFGRMLESDHVWFPRAARGEKFGANVYYAKGTEGFTNIEFVPFVG